MAVQQAAAVGEACGNTAIQLILWDQETQRTIYMQHHHPRWELLRYHWVATILDRSSLFFCRTSVLGCLLFASELLTQMSAPREAFVWYRQPLESGM